MTNPRHTFASAAVVAAQGLPMIGKLLRHAQVTTTPYAHLAADPVKAADHPSLAIARSVLGEESRKAAIND